MSYLGDINTSQILYFHFTTRQFSTGAPITAASLAVSIYKDDSTTQSTSGVTVTFTSGFDNVAGLVSVKIDTSSDGTFYAAGHDFSAVVTTGTADSVSIVGETVGYFSIQNRSGLRPATAGRTLAVDASGRALSDVDTIKTNPVVNAGTVTFPTTATLASTTNITAGTITTVTNLTNAPTAGDFTAAMKTSLNAATPAVTVSDKTGFSLTASYDFAKGTTAMTESYAANTVAPTPVQALFAMHQMLQDFSISGTTYTVLKLDHSTTAFVGTLDDATTPTSLTRT